MNKRVTELTDFQQHEFEVFRRVCFDIGTSTAPADWRTAEKAISELYRLIEKEPPRFIRVLGPLEALAALITVCQLWEQLSGQLKDQLWDQLSDQLWSQLRDQLWGQLWDQLSDQLRDQLWGQLKDQLWDRLSGQLWSQLSGQLWSQLSGQLWDQLWEQLLYKCFWGQQEIFWISYYLFCEHIGVEFKPNSRVILHLWEDISRSVSWWWPLENICILMDRPVVCNLEYQSSGLHCVNGPALRFRDGYELYALNGVRLDKEIVMTPAEELDPQLIVKERNTEIRREIVGKIGVERCFEKLGGQVMDRLEGVTGGPYELVILNIGDDRKRPFLKMKNPSTGTFHLEGVGPDCITVDEALHFRKPETMKKIPVSIDGEEWVQHGDVVIWPQEAKSLKPYPTIIT